MPTVKQEVQSAHQSKIARVGLQFLLRPGEGRLAHACLGKAACDSWQFEKVLEKSQAALCLLLSECEGLEEVAVGLESELFVDLDRDMIVLSNIQHYG